MVAAMTVTVAVGGCAPSHPPRPASARPGAAVAISQTRARSVIAQDATTLRWSWLIGRTEVQLVAQCMRRHGYTYEIPAPDPEPGPATITADALGGSGPATYGVFPHGAPPNKPGAEPVSFRDALDGAATEAASLALPDGSTVGYETGGCLGEARTRLFGSVRAYVTSAYLPQTVRDEFDAFLIADGAYTDALKAWQSCMAQRHWTFKAPAEAIASLETAQLDAASLNRRQAAIAGADRDCDLRSHLRSRRGQALARFTTGLSGQVLAELDEVSTGRDLAGRVARQTLPA
jgi:hypothetical protein